VEECRRTGIDPDFTVPTVVEAVEYIMHHLEGEFHPHA
jgi:hypothetical protein